MKKFIVTVNGSKYEVDVEEVRDGISAPAPAIQTASGDESKPAPAAVKKEEVKVDSAVPSGAQTIKSPMPGTIIKINVKTGDTVKKGQSLLILEAMKMENDISAPSDGTVASINVAQGVSVNTGDILVSLK